MALIWQQRDNSSLYEVRSAGSSIRLYTDGIFHSQWNARQPIGGNIWELLFLPALFIEPGKVRRVLVLGVGGGAVINLLHGFIKPQVIVGVDLDAIHLKLARRFFGVSADKAKLVRAEAVDWVSRYAGPSFDVIIEDLFMNDGHGEPVRAVTANGPWIQSMRRILAPSGVLVMNHESSRQLKATAGIAREKNCFADIAQLKTAHYDNAIGVFSNSPLSRNILDARLADFRETNRRYTTCKLNFTLRRV